MLTARGVTRSGVSTAPMAAPELKMPLPRLRSAGGKNSRVTRRAHGQLNDSPMPSRARSRHEQPQGRRERGGDSRKRPPENGSRIGPPHVPAVNQIAGRPLEEGISELKCRHHPTKTQVVEREIEP